MVDGATWYDSGGYDADPARYYAEYLILTAVWCWDLLDSTQRTTIIRGFNRQIAERHGLGDVRLRPADRDECLPRRANGAATLIPARNFVPKSPILAYRQGPIALLNPAPLRRLGD